MELLFIIGYFFITFVVACIVTYKKGCAFKEYRNGPPYWVKEKWEGRQVFGSLFWPGWALLLPFKGARAFFNYLEALGQKHGCGK